MNSAFTINLQHCACHWRTRDDGAVDLVLERDDGSVIGIEVMAGDRVEEAIAAKIG